MGYIDYTYYKKEYKGLEIEENEFPRLATRAEEVIDELTGYKLKSTGVALDALPIFIAAQVKKATAAQVEYLSLQGNGTEHGESDISSVSIGSFSYSEGQNPERLGRDERRTSPAVTGHLVPTGLLYKGLRVNG
jgi:hypothetical protein